MDRILILGGSSDIAMAFARLAAMNGHPLLLAGRSITKLSALKSDLEIRYQVEVEIESFDALDPPKHGDFMVNVDPVPPITVCAFGYLGDQEVSSLNWAESAKVIHTNFTGAVSILNLIANHYQMAGRGTIVGISSVAGDRGRQSNYIYGSAKAAFSTYLAGLRNRLQHAGVRVITIKPGFVNTKMTRGLPLPGPLTASPEQVGKAIMKSIRKGSNIVYVLPIWRPIMFIIRSIPEFAFKRLKL